MSIAAASPSHVFGLKSDVRDNIHYMDEQTVLYPAGSNIVLYGLEQKTQKFLPISERVDCITSMSLSMNKKCLAVAEKAEIPQIVIYDLSTYRRRKVLSLPEIETKEFASLSFSADSKFLVALSGAPEYTIYYWSWEKAKLMASIKACSLSNTNAQRISFNPNDSTQVAVTGDGIFKLYRYTEGILKQFGFQKLENRNYKCHVWVYDDRVLCGTDDSRLILFENGEQKHEYLISDDEKNKITIESLISFSKGFICGTSNGTLIIYEKSDDKDYFKKIKEMKLKDESARINNLALSPSEDTLICTLTTNQIYNISLSTTDMKNEETSLDLLSQPFHHGQITGLDICVRKPLIVTCSNDCSVRLWNYLDNSIDLVKYFPEEAYSVALHPSGLILLVGFNDKLRLMNILIDDIRPYKEFTIRGCRECRFSNGGQYFAAVHGNTIQVFSTWTFENIGNLKGHNGKVRSVYFNKEDTRLISAGMDGAIYDWSLKDLKREGENVIKSCSYTNAICSLDGKALYAVGSDKLIKEIRDSQVTKEIDCDQVLTQLCFSHSGRMLFAGTAKGTIRSIKFPFSEDQANSSSNFQEHQCHSAGVTKLRISYDDQFLFSSSEDGTLYIFRITDKDNRNTKRDVDITYAEEILVTKSDLEEKNSVMAELKTRVDELKLENEYQLRLKDMNYNEKIKELTEKFTQEIEALKITRSVLKSDKEKEEVRHEEEMAELRDKHQRELQEIEALNNQKLMAEFEKYQELQKKLTDLQAQWEKQLREMNESHQHELMEVNEQFDEKVKEKQNEVEQLQEEMKQQFKEFEETAKEIEEDADSEIMEMKLRYEKKLKEEREASLRLKGENGIMKKKFTTLQKEIDDHKSEIQRMFGEEKKLHTVIKSLEKDILGLKKEIQERDETIQDKEKRIYDLKKKNQELEKFKFVLDYKIKELKKQIEPREKEIMSMTQQIKEMDDELEQYSKQKTIMELAIHDLKLKLKASEKEKQKEKEQTLELEAYIRKFRRDLYNTVQLIQDPTPLKDHLKDMYQKYCKEVNRKQDVDPDIQLEYNRQRDHLERTVATLRSKLSKEDRTHKSDNVRIMQENVALISEINQLRKELKGIKQREKALELGNYSTGNANGAGMASAILSDLDDDDDDVHEGRGAGAGGIEDNHHLGEGIKLPPVSAI